MSWMQQQTHPFTDNKRIICRYHRLSTRFELIAEQPPAASESSGALMPPAMTENSATARPDGVIHELILHQCLYFLPRKISFSIDQRGYQLHIWPLFLWRMCRLRASSHSRMPR
ncbi:hypothetical protein [Shewanella cutis]|uniref:hypothetical protein n=1 Tax=Shewanella cutis TaxID=2766780 RepID=UPI001F0405DD|nr:hypothetical protein [Shewanella sp. PS-2]